MLGLRWRNPPSWPPASSITRAGQCLTCARWRHTSPPPTKPTAQRCWCFVPGLAEVLPHERCPVVPCFSTFFGEGFPFQVNQSTNESPFFRHLMLLHCTSHFSLQEVGNLPGLGAVLFAMDSPALSCKTKMPCPLQAANGVLQKGCLAHRLLFGDFCGQRLQGSQS